jgi:predicted  nucleic acid-binding Zn-ribbon protein
MTKKCFDVLVTASTKAEEIDTLRSFARSVCGDGSYLSSLFSNALLNWVEAQIKNDFPPDIMDVLADASTKLQEASTINSQWSASFNSVTKKLASCEEQLTNVSNIATDNLQKAFQERDATVTKLNEEITRWISNCDEVSHQRDEAQYDLRKAIAEKDRLIEKVCFLKAKLYDVEHPGSIDTDPSGHDFEMH